jgi:twitching motility protein PilT
MQTLDQHMMELLQSGLISKQDAKMKAVDKKAFS